MLWRYVEVSGSETPEVRQGLMAIRRLRLKPVFEQAILTTEKSPILRRQC